MAYERTTFNHKKPATRAGFRSTLLEYCRKYPEAATALQEWHFELLVSEFRNFNEVKKVYGNASLIGDDRVIFNIIGNKFRLVVRMVFEYKAIQIYNYKIINDIYKHGDFISLQELRQN